ncbi:peptidoglycan bridge formation glycyltransferase FemA/FemB family protein [Candidatus Woesebacteria bacterium]|nr:peptidoglycan bridge formation glycyltransferase FemA/FemB family protein [Candidatus Woesebacteria bacterium]QQG47729.1 MAG: peptidoglycan bridge formation glycyltransferase FemA/FemB family protein [Candidatus Woesebacteria bacterium]
MKNPNTHPLQSPSWAEFRKKWGNEVLETKYGYLTIHKVPVLNKKIGIFEKGTIPTSKMLLDLKKIGEEKDLIFIKLEPNVLKEEKLIKTLKDSGAARGKTIFTSTTFWIDLTKSEEELLKSFKPKTRYNIRLAERKGVKVIEDNSDKAFEKYLELTSETSKRQGFYAHNEKYHRLMWKYLREAGIAHLLVAKYKGEIITTWILFAYNGFLYYPYGASTEKYKNVMPNNLMMWEAIKMGQKLKLQIFDLWGREENKGFTKFKEGFNPKVVEFLGTWDLVIDNNSYQIYKVLEKFRWAILRAKSKFVSPSF